MKIIQISDVHYSEKYLEEVQRCMEFALGEIVDIKPDVIALTGDLFDCRLDQNSPAFLAAIEMVYSLATEAPVIILQGTFSHDAPGALDVFKNVGSSITYPICVADSIRQVIYMKEVNAFLSSDDWQFNNFEDADVLFSCLPSINKANVAAVIGTENAANAVGNQVAELLKAWSTTHLTYREKGIPTVVLSHGTVSESINEHGVPMAGMDHEYTTGSLFASKANAVMLGHIHKHQSWTNEDCIIAYPGSIGRLHFGEVDPKGFLTWDLFDDTPGFNFIETPAKRLLEVTFEGKPDMQELHRIAAECEGAHVRVRFTVDEEHRASIDKQAIEEIFNAAAECKIEGTINPVQRQRAAGIGNTESTADKLKKWCELTESDFLPLNERLEQLQSKQPEMILEEL